MKTNHRTKILALAAAAALIAGCATDNHTGALGDENETGVVVGSSRPIMMNPVPAAAPDAPTSNNGSIGNGNPFGVGPGTGLDWAQ
jgi:hypothetical protein